MNFQMLRNSFIVGSLGVSFTGFIALFSPYSQFSQFLISSGLGSLAASNLAIESSQKISNRKRSKLLAEIDSLRTKTNSFAGMLSDKHQELSRLADDRNNLADQLCPDCFYELYDLVFVNGSCEWMPKRDQDD